MLIDSISQTSQTLKRGHFHPSKQFFRSVNICSVPGEKKIDLLTFLPSSKITVRRAGVIRATLVIAENAGSRCSGNG